MSLTVRQFLNSHGVSYYIPATTINNFPLQIPQDFRVAIVNRNKSAPTSTIWLNHLIGTGGFGFVYACQLVSNSKYIQAAIKFYVHPESINNIFGLQGGLAESDLVSNDMLNEIRFSNYIQTALNHGPSKCKSMLTCFLVTGVLNIPNAGKDAYYPFVVYERMYGDCHSLFHHVLHRAFTLANTDPSLTPERKITIYYPVLLMWLYLCWQGYKQMREFHGANIYHFDYKLPNLLYRIDDKLDDPFIVKISDLGNTCAPNAKPGDPLYRPCSCKIGCSYKVPDWKLFEYSPMDAAHAEDADIFSFTSSVIKSFGDAQKKDPIIPVMFEQVLKRNFAFQKALDLTVTVTKDDYNVREYAHKFLERRWIHGDHQVGRYEHVDELMAAAFKQAYKLEMLYRFEEMRTPIDVADYAREYYSTIVAREKQIAAIRKKEVRPQNALSPSVAPMISIYNIRTGETGTQLNPVDIDPEIYSGPKRSIADIFGESTAVAPPGFSAGLAQERISSEAAGTTQPPPSAEKTQPPPSKEVSMDYPSQLSQPSQSDISMTF